MSDARPGPAPPPRDGVRSLRPSERPALLRAINRVFRPAGDADLGAALPLLLGPHNVDNLRVWARGRRIVAHAGVCFREAVIRGRSIHVALIGCVYTEPDARSQGLGSLVVADARNRAADRGADLVLVSGAGPLYRRLGFEEAPKMTRFTSQARRAPLRDRALVSVELATAADVAQMRALHDAEPARFMRDEAHWRAILETRWLIFGPAELHCVRRAGGPIATVATRRGRVLEYTGDRSAVVAAAAMLAGRAGGPSHIWQRPGDTALAEAATATGWMRETFVFPTSFAWLRRGKARTLPWYGFDYV